MELPQVDKHFQALGPLRAHSSSAELALGGPKQRLVLAVLLVHAGETVSTETLVFGVWGDEPPESARKTLQNYIHRLRLTLGDMISTVGGGYRLELGDATFDVHQFERAVDLASSTVPSGRRAASKSLRTALSLWHGPPFEDFDSIALYPEITRLNELRLVALERCLSIETDLGLPRVISELESLCMEFPTREGFRELHMRALYQAGRQAEALRAFDRTRRFLVDELGLDPSPSIRLLADQILRQDPTLANKGAFSAADPSDGSLRPSALRGFELREALEEVGNTSTFSAYQRSVGREVIIELSSGEAADQSDFITQFDEATQRLAQLSHPNLSPLIDAWREPGLAVLVWPSQELAQNTNFAELLQDSAAANRAIETVGDVLAHLHRNGHVHGRLSPDAVRLDADQNIYLTRLRAPGFGDRSLKYPAYEPPEATVESVNSLQAGDLYSFGVLVHHLLTGHAPTGVKGIDPTVDPLVLDVLAVALEANPEDRKIRVSDITRAVRRSSGSDVVAAAVASQAPKSDLRNPYKGLRAFQASDAADFFGRTAEINQVLDALLLERFVAVVGPSGIGKSSLVRAGVVPALAAQAAEAGQQLLVTEMFPGSHPMEELEAALLRVSIRGQQELSQELFSDDRGLLRASKQILPPGSSLLLVVDQFEELYSLVAEPSRRELFTANLAAAAKDFHSTIRVLVTVRADFYDRPLQDPSVSDLIRQGTIAVGAPSEEELADAIAGPARIAGLDLEPGLVAEIVRDVMGQPGGLPLMQHALTELFDQRIGNQLTVKSYRDAGRVFGALGKTAEIIWDAARGDGPLAIEQIFLRLVTVDETNDDVRRRVKRSELSSLDVPQAEVNDAIHAFGARRLLSFDRDPLTREPTVEVAHEALLREWPRFRHWLDRQRDDLILHRRLTNEVREWDDAGREPSYLLRGQRLDQYELWNASSTIRLTSDESRYLDQSRALRATEQKTDEQQRRRLRSALIGVSILATVALIAGATAFVQAARANDQAHDAVTSREESDTRRLALQAPQLVASDRRVALLLALEALRRDDGPDSLGSLQQVLVSSTGFLGTTDVDGDPVAVHAVSDDDAYVLTAAGLSHIVGSTATMVMPLRGGTALTVSPDGQTIALGDNEGLRILDAESMKTIWTHPFDSTSDSIESTRFDHSGARLGVGTRLGTVKVFDVRTGAETAALSAHPEAEDDDVPVPLHQPGLARRGVQTLAFSTSGVRLATGGLATARVWDLSSGDLLDEFRLTRPTPGDAITFAPVRAVAFADDSGTVIRAASSFSVHTRTVGEPGQPEEQLFPGRSAVLSPNSVDAAVYLDHDLGILGLLGGRITAIRRDSADVVEADSQGVGIPEISLAPDGRILVIASNNAVTRWALDGSGLLSQTVPFPGGGGEVTFSADGRFFGLSLPDKERARLFELTGEGIQEIPLPRKRHFLFLGPTSGYYSMDLERLSLEWVTFDDPGGPGESLGPLRSPYSFVSSSDGRLAVFGSGTPQTDAVVLQIFDRRTESLRRIRVDLEAMLPNVGLAEADGALSVTLSPDESRLIVATLGGSAGVFDTRSWESLLTFSEGGGQVIMAAFAPDNSRVVTMAQDGEILFRDPDTLQPTGAPLLGQTDGIQGFSHRPSFSADGRYMFTTDDGDGRVWDMEQRVSVGQAFPNSGFAAGVSADGRRMGTFHDDRVIIWNTQLSSWAAIACEAAGRNLTLDEWEQFGPNDTAYEKTCDQWP